MSDIHIEILETESNLGLIFPTSYRRFLEEKGKDIVFGLPIYGLPSSHDIDSVLGATEALRFIRSDLPAIYLAIRFLDSRALCIDLSNGNKDDAPLVEIELADKTTPKTVHSSFSKYLEEDKNIKFEINDAIRRIDNLFGHEINKQYDRKRGGERIPFKARDWRVMRSCVHDQVVGLTAFRHNEKFNGLEVDVFISTDHPDYKQGHGIRALMLLLLSDAFRNGATMEMRFTRFSKGSRIPDKIPNSLIKLFEENNIHCSRQDEGVITHDESVILYASILGISAKLRDKIRNYEIEKRLSLQGLCYIISSGIWTIEEASWILFNCPRPEGVLFGKDLPEDRMRYAESLGYGRAAIALTKFRNKLENNISENEGDSFTEMDGRLLKIVPKQPSEIDWAASSKPIQILPDEELAVLPRPSKAMPNEEELLKEDISIINLFTKGEMKKFLLYSSDFSETKGNIDTAKISKDEKGIEILLLPYSSRELDEEVGTRMSRARVVRL